MFESTTSDHGTSINKVLKGETIKGPHQATRTLGSLINIFGPWIRPMRIVMGDTSVLAVVRGFEPLEALHLGIVDILGKRDERIGRSRSIGSRHFNRRMR